MKLFLPILMVILCAGVAIAETATGGDYTWTCAEEGGAWKIKSVSPATGDLVVPCTLGGKPVVSWSPDLKPEQAALRKYTTYGKVSLADKKWNEVAGDAAKYNFFKVAVEMK